MALALSVAGAPVRGQSRSDFIKEGDFANQLLVALESGNKAEAQRLMTGDTAQMAFDVIKDLPDPKSKSARTAYDVRKDMAERVMKETARKVAADPNLKGRLISIELGGTAGKEGVGFTPGTADLDFQLRGTDAEASQAAADIAKKVMADLGIPMTEKGNLFKINPFPANLDESPVIRDTEKRKGLNANQAERIGQGEARHANPEASKGDAIDAVREDYYRRGVAYEVDPETGELRANPVTGELRTTPVDELYDKRGWPAPKVTEASAFGVVVNERELFGTLRDTSDAKRVVRAADAIELADRSALTPDERAAVELSRRIYQTRDLERAVQSLPKNHQARATYDRMLKEGRPRDIALNTALQQQDEVVRNIFNKGMVTTLDAKLADIERTKAMSDSALLDEHNRRFRQGDTNAQTWLDQYRTASVEQKTDMLKAARENLMEQKRLGLLDSFRFLPAETRARLVNDPRFAGNALVTNASALAEVMNNAHDAMVRARQALNSALDQALPPAAKKTGLEPSAEYHPGYAGGGLIRAGDRLLIAVALSGALDGIVTETMKAYDRGGNLAAAQVFVQRTAATASDVAVGMVYQYLVETIGLAAEARGLLWRGVTAGANAAMTIAALVEVSKVVGNAIWRSAQDPFLRSQLDPTANVSFYQTMQARPITLWADVQRYAQRNRGPLRARGVDPNDSKAALREMIRDFFRDSGARAADMTGFEDRMFEALDAQATQSREFLAGLREAGIESERAAVAKRVEAEAKARAEAAARKAKEQLDERRERQAAAREKAAKEEAARERAARAAAAAKQAEEQSAEPDPATRSAEERWQTLQREKQAEDEAVRRQQAELARQQDAARRRLEEENRRNVEETRRLEEMLLQKQMEEVELLSEATIDINVPATMQPGAQAAIGVAVRAPGLRLSGRRVAIRATPGHTDDGSIPLDAGGRGRTNYVAPADYNGYVRVTVQIEGGMQVSRTFLVGKPVAEAPPEQKIENPEEVTLPETKEPAPPPPAPPQAASGPCAMHTLAKLKEYVIWLRAARKGLRPDGAPLEGLDAVFGETLWTVPIGEKCMAGCAAINGPTEPSDAALQACIDGK
ncbi:MAG: hypothetical protein Q8T13_01355 [Acidobacteriota bacterium]|nr:hypothetical protein [Acidobacteriota bacterium]